MTWIRHDVAKRGQYLSDLLIAVRLPLISSKYLVDHIEKVRDTSVLGSDCILYLVNEASSMI